MPKLMAHISAKLGLQLDGNSLVSSFLVSGTLEVPVVRTGTIKVAGV